MVSHLRPLSRAVEGNQPDGSDELVDSVPSTRPLTLSHLGNP